MAYPAMAATANLEALKVEVNRIVFQSPDGYCVIRCTSLPDKTDLIVTGHVPDIRKEMTLQIEGQWFKHPKFGRQFKMLSYKEVQPTSRHGLERYLASGVIKGVGPTTAKQLVDTFGEDVIDILDHNPEELRKIPGIGKKKLNKIIASWGEQKKIREIMIYLQQYDISANLATRIYKFYGKRTKEVITSNPYALADDIDGVGFKTADAIAANMGIARDSYGRIRSGLLYTLGQEAVGGSIYATRDDLTGKTEELLNVDPSLITISIDNMIHEQDLIAETLEDEGGQALFLPMYYYSEIGIAHRLHQIAETYASVRVNTDGLEEVIQEETGMHYADRQMQAIFTAVTNKLTVLTGGPGTGKTTTTLGIITAFQTVRSNIRLAAPTGRAAKRLSEASGMEALTIHRLLESDATGHFNRNADNPIEGDVLIIDECSMIDVLLMNSLLKAVPNTMTVIFVGDADQLPSVGAGNVLHDMIASADIPVVRLNQIFRQAAASRIITNAHRVNAGRMPDISNKPGTDFYFLEEDDTENAKNRIVDLVSRQIPKYFPFKPSDIQVLAPMKKSAVGTYELNVSLQEALNPGREGLHCGATLFKKGDRVMQTRNNYNKGVFNGDVGTIINVDTDEGELTVDFQGAQVIYQTVELNELVLAYACTVHKSQGSEYPVVVMPVMTAHYIMLKKNLLYTGFTRAKKLLILIGQKKALYMGVKTEDTETRNTRLTARIRSSFEG